MQGLAKSLIKRFRDVWPLHSNQVGCQNGFQFNASLPRVKLVFIIHLLITQGGSIFLFQQAFSEILALLNQFENKKRSILPGNLCPYIWFLNQRCMHLTDSSMDKLILQRGINLYFHLKVSFVITCYDKRGYKLF